MLDPQLIKAHLRLDDDEFVDQLPLLQAYARAARRLVENRTGRQLVDLGELPEGELPLTQYLQLPEDAPENALPVDDDVRLAMLVLVAHWYSNREAVTEDGQAKTLPLAFEALVEPYRWFTL